jgi:hypothetical protein
METVPSNHVAANERSMLIGAAVHSSPAALELPQHRRPRRARVLPLRQAHQVNPWRETLACAKVERVLADADLV